MNLVRDRVIKIEKNLTELKTQKSEIEQEIRKNENELTDIRNSCNHVPGNTFYSTAAYYCNHCGAFLGHMV